MNRIEILTRASGLHDAKQVESLKSDLLRRIGANVPFDLADVTQPSAEGLVAILVLTGGVERDVLKLVARLPSPTLLIAHEGHNSLPASLEILARIRQDGGEGRILFGPPETIAAGLAQELAVADAWQKLRFSRVGLIGEPSEWLVASDIDRAFLKGRLSIELVSIGVDRLVEEIASVAAPRKAASRFTKDATMVDGPNGGDVQGAIAIYEGLRKIVDANRLSACTVRCFDLLDRLRNTGCYALSRLNDERVPAGCEGDLQSLFTLYVAFLLTDQVAFMGNVSAVDLEDRVVSMAHCTCPLSLTAQYSIQTHFESGLGVGISGDVPPGPCTVFRLGGERLNHLFVRDGEIVGRTQRDDLCRTQLRVRVDDPIDELLHAPLGNHHILVAGHHRETIERFFNRYLRS